MKKKILSLLVILLISVTGCYTQSVVTVSGTSGDISENLNLEAVATLFGESRNLGEFEAMLNDPRNQISNLDLNHDGYVDYIRVVESRENGVYYITLQDVLGNNLFQDLATIDVYRNGQGYPQVEIVGDPYFYGPNYIIQPVFETRPLIFSIFWNPDYRLWVSPYYWGYYPHFFRPWRVLSLYHYRTHIHSFIRAPRFYRYLHTRSHHGPVIYQHRGTWNAYERMHPGQGFIHRNHNYRNAHDLYQKRNSFNHNVRPSNIHKQKPVRNNKIKSGPVRVKKAPAKYRGAPARMKIKRPSGYRNIQKSNKNIRQKKSGRQIKEKAKVRNEKPKGHIREKKKDKKR